MMVNEMGIFIFLLATWVLTMRNCQHITEASSLMVLSPLGAQLVVNVQGLAMRISVVAWCHRSLLLIRFGEDPQHTIQ